MHKIKVQVLMIIVAALFNPLCVEAVDDLDVPKTGLENLNSEQLSVAAQSVYDELLLQRQLLAAGNIHTRDLEHTKVVEYKKILAEYRVVVDELAQRNRHKLSVSDEACDLAEIPENLNKATRNFIKAHRYLKKKEDQYLRGLGPLSWEQRYIAQTEWRERHQTAYDSLDKLELWMLKANGVDVLRAGHADYDQEEHTQRMRSARRTMLIDHMSGLSEVERERERTKHDARLALNEELKGLSNEERKARILDVAYNRD